MSSRARRTTLYRVGLMALIGGTFGLALGGYYQSISAPSQLYLPLVPTIYFYPLPHHVPKYRDGISLRFAMVQDVIHERFPRHGKAYYTERNRTVLRELEKNQAGLHPRGSQAERYFALRDDLGAGLDHLGEHDAAIRELREKLQQQGALGYEGLTLYTTYANLGTFLIHGSFLQARAGDPEARERLREGLSFIQRSIEVNPQAHFGREVWQAAAVEFLLAALNEPDLLVRYDMVGNRLDKDFTFLLPYGDSLITSHTWIDDGLRAKKYLDRSVNGEPDAKFRQQITLVGAEDGWSGVFNSYRKPVPFDEPTLGIIGMWRLGGGANPHFALALGEIMLRVGQRYIAWCAYERAVLMADRFWPEPPIREKFIAHCKGRQSLIEEHLPAEERSELRPRFQAELEYGQRYQEAYQRYEEDGIAQGASIDDPHFYDDFDARHGPIASPVGKEDVFIVKKYDSPNLLLASVLLFGGIFAFGTAVFLRLRTQVLTP